MTDALKSSGGRHRQRVMNLEDEADLKFRLVDRAITAAQESRRAISGTLVILGVLIVIVVGTVLTLTAVIDRMP